MNSEISKIVGTPLNASEGNLTRPVSVSGPGNLGMGRFSPRAGANTKGKYLVDGVGGVGGGKGGKRSSLRSAGESR